jgi:hypothetical protein
LDDLTFLKLKESKYYQPEITDVITDYKMMLDLVADAVGVTEKGYDTVIDSVMFNFLLKYFKHGIDLIDKRIEETGVKMRMIVDANSKNIDALNAIKFYEIKHADGIRGNFGIWDNRAYTVFIFHKESEQPDQTLWSNSKELVDKQQTLFDKMWDLAIPLSVRNKELKYQQVPQYRDTLTNSSEVKAEISNVVQQCREELLIISSVRILNLLLLASDFLTQVSILLKRGVKIRILCDSLDTDIVNKFNFINSLKLGNELQYGYSNQFNKFNELVIINDGKTMLRCILEPSNEFMAHLSTNEAEVLVQEILFEKSWNEIKSLDIVNNN